MYLSCRIILGVRIFCNNSFNYTMQYLLECLDVFVLYANSGCEDCLEIFA